MKLSSIKTQLGIFLGIFALYLSFIDKDFPFLRSIFIAILFAAAADSIITYIKDKRLIIAESSIISGFIIGYVVSSDLDWRFIGLASIAAIGSKHLIRFHGRHIFNPAAFGIFLTAICFGIFTQWKAAYMWYILIPFGLYFTSRIKRIDIVVSYLACSLVLYGSQAAIHQVSLLDIFGYLNYFFIFVMLIEPKTTPFNRSAKILFGSGVALLTFILYETGIKLEVELAALLCFNLLNLVINKERKRL